MPDHPYTDPGDGRSQCIVCRKFVWPTTHSCKGVPMAELDPAARHFDPDDWRAELPEGHPLRSRG